jgi:hypothetical protein
MIYGYALTEEGGLVADVDSKVNTWIRFRAADNDDHTHESNQLRFVCCQLHVETSALSLRYNDLTFGWRSYRFQTVYDMFDRFYETCAPNHLNDIKGITILDHETLVPTEQVCLSKLLSPTLIRFCQERPYITVIVRFMWLNDAPQSADDDDEIIDSMIFLSKILERPHFFPSEEGGFITEMVEKLVTNFEGVECPSNPRFTCAHLFDEDAAWRNAHSIIDAMLDGRDEDFRASEIMKWVEIARRVHEIGI